MGFRTLFRDLRNHLGTDKEESAQNLEDDRTAPASDAGVVTDGFSFNQAVTILVPASEGTIHTVKELAENAEAPDARDADGDADGDGSGEPEAPEEVTAPDEETVLAVAHPKVTEEPEVAEEPDQVDAAPRLRQPMSRAARSNAPSTGLAGSWNRRRDRDPWFTGRWWEKKEKAVHRERTP